MTNFSDSDALCILSLFSWPPNTHKIHRDLKYLQSYNVLDLQSSVSNTWVTAGFTGQCTWIIIQDNSFFGHLPRYVRGLYVPFWICSFLAHCSIIGTLMGLICSPNRFESPVRLYSLNGTPMGLICYLIIFWIELLTPFYNNIHNLFYINEQIIYNRVT